MSYDPKNAVRHVVHDYAYLVAAGTDTQRPLKHPFNHYAERTFLVHCRAFADFVSDKRHGRDLYARHFTQKEFVRTVATWNQWRDHIDKHLMHLTVGRITNQVRWTGEVNRLILEDIRAVWQEFLTELRDDLEPHFTHEIERHRQDFVGYSL